jgi:hypothetical protein
MKRSLSLLAVAMVTAASAGCNCCPCLRNICPFRSYAPAAVPTYAAVPAACPAPVYAAAPAPVYAAPQQYTVPQYAMPAAQPVYSDAGCGSAAPCPCAAPYACAAPCATCPCESSCGMSYTVADPSCGYSDAGYGMPMEQTMVDPSPAP